MNHKPKPIKLQEFVQLRDERSLVTLEEMIPCKFYDPTSLRSSDLVKNWKSSHGRKWKMKLTAKERNDERVLWFFLSPLNDQKSPLKSWSCYMRAIGSNSIKIQDKILALGSIRVYPPKIFLITSYNKTHAQSSRIATNVNHKNVKPTERTSIVFPFQNLSPNLFSATVIFFHTSENYYQNIS